MQGKKRGLGKGLDSLLSSSTVSRKKQVSHDFHAEKTHPCTGWNHCDLDPERVVGARRGRAGRVQGRFRAHAVPEHANVSVAGAEARPANTAHGVGGLSPSEWDRRTARAER